VNITLPDGLSAWVEQRAVLAGFASAEEYVAELLRREQEREREDGATELTWREVLAREGVSPESLSPEEVERGKGELAAKLLESLASGPPIEVTPTFWEERRRRLAERMAARRKGEA